MNSQLIRVLLSTITVSLVCLSTVVQAAEAPKNDGKYVHLNLDPIVPTAVEKPYFSVNQVGYITDSVKRAYYVSPDPLGEDLPNISLVQVSEHESLSELPLTQISVQEIDGVTIYAIDFSEIKKDGWYYLQLEKVRSPRFVIKEYPYESTNAVMLRSFYLQRCGVELNDPFTGLAHAACHIHDGELSETAILDKPHMEMSHAPSVGGWHDAGDFGKYVSTATVTVGQMLMLFQLNEDVYANMPLAIPESNNELPDILDEIKFELDWLETMQRSDGAVYRKIGGKKWPRLGPPDGDWKKRYIYGIATDDTAKFVATFAMAARIYEKYDSALADHYHQLALKSWSFLEDHEDFILQWKKSDDGGSGPYKSNSTDIEESLKVDTDDRFWAAAEMYLLTGEKQYQKAMEPGLELPLNLYEWKDPAFLGKYNYLRDKTQHKKRRYVKAIREQLLERAEEALNRVDNSTFRIANHRYIWGSNKMAAVEGFFLMAAYEELGDARYRDAALDQVNYILGANAFSMSFVTGVGERPVRHTSHIYVRGSQVLVPGLLVGGPNIKAQAKVAPKDLGQLSYVDSAKSYAVNEYAIDYNAALIALMAMVQHIR